MPWLSLFYVYLICALYRWNGYTEFHGTLHKPEPHRVVFLDLKAIRTIVSSEVPIKKQTPTDTLAFVLYRWIVAVWLQLVPFVIGLRPTSIVDELVGLGVA